MQGRLAFAPGACGRRQDDGGRRRLGEECELGLFWRGHGRKGEPHTLEASGLERERRGRFCEAFRAKKKSPRPWPEGEFGRRPPCVAPAIGVPYLESGGRGEAIEFKRSLEMRGEGA